MSVSLVAKSELAQNDNSAVVKPQIIKPSSSSNDATIYKVVKGDTVPSVADKFNVSADTIRWANSLSNTDALEPGRKLKILPVSGVLYTAKSGDTANKIAQRFNADSNRIVTFNDLELSGVKPGKTLIIPEGRKPRPEPTSAPAPQNQSFTGDLGGGVISSNLSITAGNRYAAGNCTWYAYERRAQLGRPVGSFWGNANTWASNARAAGYTVNNSPASGAVLTDQAGYFGHVGVVERVKSNGDIVITEMNNYAYGGFNIVNERTISAGQARSYLYIH